MASMIRATTTLQYDKLLEQAANESDLEKRKGIMEAAERMLLRGPCHHATLFLCHQAPDQTLCERLSAKYS